jgi:hypothetical protein
VNKKMLLWIGVAVAVYFIFLKKKPEVNASTASNDARLNTVEQQAVSTAQMIAQETLGIPTSG